MKRFGLLLAVGLVVVACPLANTSPTGGQFRTSPEKRIKIGAGDKWKAPAITFKGGERACVIVEGDHRPVVDLFLTVYDADGKVVAEDRRGGDLCAVVWYPPVDGDYTLEVHNTGTVFNAISLSFK
jgi:hypothetical protein